MVDLGAIADYLNVGGPFDYAPFELGSYGFVNLVPSFIPPIPSPSFDFGVGVGISRSFYGSLFSPTYSTYEQSKWEAAEIIGTMGDAVFNTDRMIYGALGVPFHFITPMPVPYIPVSAPSNPDPSFFDRPMQRHDPAPISTPSAPVAEDTGLSGQPPATAAPAPKEAKKQDVVLEEPTNYNGGTMYKVKGEAKYVFKDQSGALHWATFNSGTFKKGKSIFGYQISSEGTSLVEKQVEPPQTGPVKPRITFTRPPTK